MINDSDRLAFLELYSMFSTEELTHAQYDTLRDLAARHLSYQTLVQCLAPKLPGKPGVSEAWEILADRIMCSDEEAEKRRIFQREVESRMRRGKAEHNRRKREQNEKRYQAMETIFGQQRKLQKVIDKLQESMNDLQNQLQDLK
jgi:hypothetical protein